MKPYRNLRPVTLTLVALIMASIPAGAKASRHFSLAYAASVGGTQIAPGNYNVSWVQHSPQATVTFMKGKQVVATAEAKWVERNTKYERNMVVFASKPDGSRAILELRFAGMSRALVFDNAPASP